MLTHLYRLIGAAMVVSAVGCGNTPDDFEGADNTSPVAAPSTCPELRPCCLALDESSQSQCLDIASAGKDADCSLVLQQYRADGTCQ